MLSMMLGSTAISALGAIRQGQATANALNFNAAMADKNAKIAEGQGIAAGESQQRDAARRIGAATAAYGASGVQLSDGSPMDVLGESARLATLDNLTLKYNYKLKGMGLAAEASLDRANASNSRTASYFNAAGSMLNSGTQMAGYFS